MGELIRTINWPATPLGDPETWPTPLKLMTGMMLTSSFPTLICWGEDYIQLYNDSFRPINGATKHPQAMGGRACDTYAEIWDTIGPMFAGVMKGQTFGFPNFMVPLNRYGFTEECYFDFSYSPIIDEQGRIGGVLVICIETTEKVYALKIAEKAQQDLELSRAATAKERDRLKRFFMQAPAGICILDGPDFVFELINPSYQQIMPGRNLLDRPLFEALPELADQLHGILLNVYTTGQAFGANELLIPVAEFEGGPLHDRYFNFIYEPRLDESGKVDGIMVFVFEVTDMVVARHKTDRTEESLRIAVEAAELGSFSMNTATREFETSSRLRDFFGFAPDEQMSYEAALKQVHPDDRQTVADMVEASIVDGTRFDTEFRVIGKRDERLRWVRAVGTVQQDNNKAGSCFTGVVHEITEQKQDELRKNDFIGMVSHELKTPLTSLSALVQVLNAKLKNTGDPFVSGALQKVQTQLRKMAGMINGFLNVSRLESGKIHMEKREFDLRQLLAEIIKETELTVSSHQIRFDPGDAVLVNADRDRISSVISNLLSNAVKYSPKGSVIEVACQVINNAPRVCIKDHGIGIKQVDLEKLFERYYRIDNPNTRHISGFGIGLYLSAEIIQRHNGEIWAESEVGAGSTFYFTLP